MLPLSLVLLTRSDTYLDGLTAYRHDRAASSADAQSCLETWLWTFLHAAELAVDQVSASPPRSPSCEHGGANGHPPVGTVAAGSGIAATVICCCGWLPCMPFRGSRSDPSDITSPAGVIRQPTSLLFSRAGECEDQERQMGPLRASCLTY